VSSWPRKGKLRRFWHARGCHAKPVFGSAKQAAWRRSRRGRVACGPYRHVGTGSTCFVGERRGQALPPPFTLKCSYRHGHAARCRQAGCSIAAADF
jgi:hypothetical protein